MTPAPIITTSTLAGKGSCSVTGDLSLIMGILQLGMGFGLLWAAAVNL
jgi:hypothetical protein